jgi:2',3'-cyclic-nucleotide 2'-phosphodiesterase (5'-nucleotidase family)
MKRAFLLLIALLMAVGLWAQQPGNVVILFENDVHCAIEGYPVLAGLRDSLQKKGCAVAVVSAGDFSFGGPIGAASKGEYVVRMMNAVGYDAATLGNHEFDYGMGQLRELEKQLKAPMLCCNLRQHALPEAFNFLPFVIRDYNGVRVAFVGVTTPTTLYTSLPTAFQDAKGQYLYHFCATSLAACVQQSVDMVRAAGAQAVVLLSHLGDSDGEPTSVEVMKQVRGVDLVLDGHDHHVIPQRTIVDKDGDKLLLASTGTQFQYIGMAVLSDEISTRLVPVDSLLKVGCINAAVADTLRVVKESFEALGSRVIGSTRHDLIAEEGDIRVVRLRETNLGDLVADAFRHAMNTDVGWANGGGVRANIPMGEITHNQLFAVCPYVNHIVAIRTTGQDLLNALETAVREYPKAEGCFAQVSGVSFDIDPTIPSGVVLDQNGRFLRVEGAYRVSNVRVGGKPLELEDSYTIAGSEYALINGGDAIYFPHKEVLGRADGTDLELVEQFITEQLGGVVTAPYDKPQGRINFK